MGTSDESRCKRSNNDLDIALDLLYNKELKGLQNPVGRLQDLARPKKDERRDYEL